MMEVYNNVDQKLFIPKCLLPDGKTEFYPHHFNSTIQDNLVELAGRICYDSTKMEKTRNSQDYHKHINDVKHGSTQEHINFSVQFNMFEYLDMLKVYASLTNMPGVQVDWVDNLTIVVTANLRVINEWALYLPVCPDWQPHFFLVGTVLNDVTAKVCPLAHSRSIPAWDNSVDCLFKQVAPSTDDQIFISYHVDKISRNLTHELVRHKFRTAISQRSTRYVDESESDIMWHPFFEKYKNEIGTAHVTLAAQDQQCYKDLVSRFEQLLISDGVDKFTAQKQARGAARGVLPSALSTEAIFTASLSQWKRMFKMRMSDHADAEIRLMFSYIFSNLKNHPNVQIKDSFNDFADDYAAVPARDSIGKHLCPI